MVVHGKIIRKTIVLFFLTFEIYLLLYLENDISPKNGAIQQLIRIFNKLLYRSVIHICLSDGAGY